ncbi:hypothetical protein B9Z55_024480 [Caenorhabditis nigoni]|nr:hypothetical protein B9Z55_024480 [Caenorhabditis nigoni]
MWFWYGSLLVECIMGVSFFFYLAWNVDGSERNFLRNQSFLFMFLCIVNVPVFAYIGNGNLRALQSSQFLGKSASFLFLPTFLATTELHIGYRDYAFSKKLFLGVVSQVVSLGLLYAEVKRLFLLFEDASMLNPFNYKSPTNSQTNVAMTQTDVMSSQNPAATIA